MSLIADPVARARAVTTARQAARLHMDLEHEVEFNASASPEWLSKANDALDVLESTWGADELRETATDAGYTPNLSKQARAGVEGGAKPTVTARRAAKASGAPSPAAGSSGGAAGRTGTGRRRSSRSSSRRGAGSRTFARTGLPAAADSTTGFVLQLVGGTIGLALLYALISGRGPQALTGASDALLAGLRGFMAPTDPLAPKAKAKGFAANGGFGGGEIPAGAGVPNAYERGVLAGQFAGPASPTRAAAGPPTPAP